MFAFIFSLALFIATHCHGMEKHQAPNDCSILVEQFSNISTVRQLDEAIVIQWILQVSDLTQDDVLSAKKFDPESPWQLYAYGTATSVFLKLPWGSCECAGVEKMVRLEANGFKMQFEDIQGRWRFASIRAASLQEQGLAADF